MGRAPMHHVPLRVHARVVFVSATLGCSTGLSTRMVVALPPTFFPPLYYPLYYVYVPPNNTYMTCNLVITTPSTLEANRDVA